MITFEQGEIFRFQWKVHMSSTEPPILTQMCFLITPLRNVVETWKKHRTNMDMSAESKHWPKIFDILTIDPSQTRRVLFSSLLIFLKPNGSETVSAIGLPIVDPDRVESPRPKPF